MTTPKRNEAVAPVAWTTPKQMDHFDKVREEGVRDTWADVWLRQREPYTVPLYRASVVEALQGEVSRLRAAAEADSAYLRHLISAISAFKGKRGAFMALGAQDARTVRLWELLNNLEPPTDAR